MPKPRTCNTMKRRLALMTLALFVVRASCEPTKEAEEKPAAPVAKTAKVRLKTSSGDIAIAVNINLDDDLVLDAAGAFSIGEGFTLAARTLSVTGATATTTAIAALKATAGSLAVRSTDAAAGSMTANPPSP